jgi:hypothetical protein
MRGRISAFVMVYDVVLRPKRLKCRHGHNDPAIGFDDLSQAFQNAEVILNMLNDIERDDAIEGACRKGNRVDGATNEPLHTARIGKGNRLGGGVDPERDTDGFEMLQHLPSSTPGIEDARRRPKVQLPD